MGNTLNRHSVHSNSNSDFLNVRENLFNYEVNEWLSDFSVNLLTDEEIQKYNAQLFNSISRKVSNERFWVEENNRRILTKIQTHLTQNVNKIEMIEVEPKQIKNFTSSFIEALESSQLEPLLNILKFNFDEQTISIEDCNKINEKIKGLHVTRGNVVVGVDSSELQPQFLFTCKFSNIISKTNEQILTLYKQLIMIIIVSSISPKG